jgi:hypothetical protein
MMDSDFGEHLRKQEHPTDEALTASLPPLAMAGVPDMAIPTTVSFKMKNNFIFVAVAVFVVVCFY